MASRGRGYSARGVPPPARAVDAAQSSRRLVEEQRGERVAEERRLLGALRLHEVAVGFTELALAAGEAVGRPWQLLGEPSHRGPDMPQRSVSADLDPTARVVARERLPRSPRLLLLRSAQAFRAERA